MTEGSLPPGLSLRHTLRGHKDVIRRIAWAPDGARLATPAGDRTVRIWDTLSGQCLHNLRDHEDVVYAVAWSSADDRLFSGGREGILRLWDTENEKTLLEHRLDWHAWINCMAWAHGLLVLGLENGVIWLLSSASLFDDVTVEDSLAVSHGNVNSLAWHPERLWFASGQGDGHVEIRAFKSLVSFPIGRLPSPHSKMTMTVAWSPDGSYVASGSIDASVGVSDLRMRQQRHLEGHTAKISSVSFSYDNRLLATKSADNTVRLWRCEDWRLLCEIHESSSGRNSPGIAFHPTQPVLATLGNQDTEVRIWDLEIDRLLQSRPWVAGPKSVEIVHHATAKIVLVGDSGVGKTGLGWRLAHDSFQDHPSTHGQQFWLLDQLKTKTEEGVQCEAVLWDLAGQPDYRLTHALFLDDADVALVLFDPTNSQDPLQGVEYWLQALPEATTVMLVAGRIDRGDAAITQQEIEAFCADRQIHGGYIATSARRGDGINELMEKLQETIRWEAKAKTVTTQTFKRIKDFVLGLKEDDPKDEILMEPPQLRERLETIDTRWEFTDNEMMTAVGHLAKHGYVRVLRTATGDETILLAPELLNNLAASFVLEARRNPKGLGALEEQRVLLGDYDFPEIEVLSEPDRETLLDATATLFFENNLCFRESHGNRVYLIFPELIHRKKPRVESDIPTVEDVAYTVSGAVENVFAALVVRLGYTNLFTRTDQWHGQARYEVGDGEICGFRQTDEREGEIDLVLYYSNSTPAPSRTLFQGLFEIFLARREVDVARYPRVTCPECGYLQDRSVIMQRVQAGKGFLFCNECGAKSELPKTAETISLTVEQSREVSREQRTADTRTRFEAILVQVKALVEELRGDVSPERPAPSCFVSYAWGEPEHERWVEKSLATDLRHAEIDVILDRWENKVGTNLQRFVSRIAEADWIVAVGTPLYQEKVENKVSSTGSVVAAEADLIFQRMTGLEAQKESVLPVLRAGEKEEALPPLLRGGCHADFREASAYFSTLLDLILTLYDVPFDHPAVLEWREALAPDGSRR